MKIIKYRKIWFAISGTLFIGAILVWIAIGFRFGLDFTGGSLSEIKYDNVVAPTQQEIETKLSDLDLSLSVSATGESGYLLRYKNVDEQTHQEVIDRLKSLVPTAEKDVVQGSMTELRHDSIGPAIGKELKTQSIYATFAILLAIGLYVAYAFRKVSYPVSSWKYGIATLIALFHDIIITIGLFIVLGYVYKIEINTPFIAALLTVLGYSVNDTIVVFDRIRENLHKFEGDFEEIVEKSVNDTVRRSITTSVTVLICLLAVLVFGGDSIKNFVMTLIFGIIIGTYSSIFLASPILVTWQQLSWKLKKGKS